MPQGPPPKKISYRAKTPTKCPVCKTEHFKEDLLSGGGRLIAGKLTQELRRLYEPSKKWGEIYPLAYTVQVCPKCLYAAYPKDFKGLNEEELKAIKTTIPHREELMKVVFGNIDFNENRNLVLGAASYMLAIDCYHLRSWEMAPTVKKAVSSIRAAWLLGDLHKKFPARPYDKASNFYYVEAARGYARILDIMNGQGEEPIESAAYMLGPDLDHNWGFDGIMYLNAYLTLHHLDEMADTLEQQYKILDTSKRYLSKLYGSGKASKSKPSVIVDMAKDLYDEMGEKLKEMEAQLNPAAASG
ncbi:MAG: DUF2225 domain-containing protein [Candidatus Hydrogenedentota bacterium]|nr:MAG: DUF2225 domain-containing protein [Candidatus Hydrogenedentota bacterium]